MYRYTDICVENKSCQSKSHVFIQIDFILISINICCSYTLDIEAVSCDEMFVDCTYLLNSTGTSVLQFASVLRAEIKVSHTLILKYHKLMSYHFSSIIIST